MKPAAHYVWQPTTKMFYKTPFYKIEKKKINQGVKQTLEMKRIILYIICI